MPASRLTTTPDWSRRILGCRAAGVVLIGLAFPLVIEGVVYPFITSGFLKGLLEEPMSGVFWIGYYAAPIAGTAVGLYLLVRDNARLFGSRVGAPSHE